MSESIFCPVLLDFCLSGVFLFSPDYAGVVVRLGGVTIGGFSFLVFCLGFCWIVGPCVDACIISLVVVFSVGIILESRRGQSPCSV